MPVPLSPPVVPKGLRAFDQHDAAFFLELLPGPRDRDGLPESLRFWKTRCETQDIDAIPVGLLYGPPGSGKSSFVRAGLLTQLEDSIMPVYLQATAENTESSIHGQLRRLFPELPDELTLPEKMAALRRRYRIASRQKIVACIGSI